jgi:F-type H+-transporting ATPase subunit b
VEPHIRILADHNPVIPDGTELILGAISFAIVFFFLYVKVLPGIKKLLDERTEAIEGGLQKAEVAQAEAERIKQEFTAKLAESRHEAAEVRAKAQAEGAALVDKARDEAVKQRESIVAAGHAQLNADRNSAVSVLKAELGKLAVELADKIIGERSTDAALQERVIDRFLDDLDARLGTAEPATSGTTAAGTGAPEQVG